MSLPRARRSHRSGLRRVFAGVDVTESELPADKGKPLVFYCANTHCGASHTAAEKARLAGYTNVKFLPEGIAAGSRPASPSPGASAGHGDFARIRWITRVIVSRRSSYCWISLASDSLIIERACSGCQRMLAALSSARSS